MSLAQITAEVLESLEKTEATAAARPRSYGADWDAYVENFEYFARQEPTNRGRTDLHHPGDEWGTPESWTALAQKFLLPFLPPARTGVAVEIGQGSGKYTLEILDQVRQVICFDVSNKFLEVARKRLAGPAAEGRVEFELLSLSDCNEITQRLAQRGLVGNVDLFFSIDAMVHVELHTLFAYLVSAAHSLKLGGHLAMTVASCTNPRGFQRLVDETPWYYGGTRAGHQFYFLSPEIVRHLCQQLGFEIVLLDEGRNSKFITFTARKARNCGLTLKPNSA